MSRKRADQSEAVSRSHPQTGPRTDHGKRMASRNSIKHGLCATAILEFAGEQERAVVADLTEQFRRTYAPANFLEEALVDRMVSAYFRLARVIRYELQAGMDEARKRFQERNPDWKADENELKLLKRNPEAALLAVRAATLIFRSIREDANQGKSIVEAGGRYGIMMRNRMSRLERDVRRYHPTDETFREACLVQLDAEIAKQKQWEEYCNTVVTGHGLSSEMPSGEVLERIVRYEANLERQFYRAMDQLERLQRQRLGDHMLPPVRINID
jgi:hypothetical protein